MLVFASMIPGQLQTGDYARWLVEDLSPLHGGKVDVERTVAERLARTRHLNSPDKRFTFLMTEQQQPTNKK